MVTVLDGVVAIKHEEKDLVLAAALPMYSCLACLLLVVVDADICHCQFIGAVEGQASALNVFVDGVVCVERVDLVAANIQIIPVNIVLCAEVHLAFGKVVLVLIHAGGLAVLAVPDEARLTHIGLYSDVMLISIFLHLEPTQSANIGVTGCIYLYF